MSAISSTIGEACGAACGGVGACIAGSLSSVDIRLLEGSDVATGVLLLEPFLVSGAVGVPCLRMLCTRTWPAEQRCCLFFVAVKRRNQVCCALFGLAGCIIGSASGCIHLGESFGALGKQVQERSQHAWGQIHKWPTEIKLAGVQQVTQSTAC